MGVPSIRVLGTAGLGCWAAACAADEVAAGAAACWQLAGVTATDIKAEHVIKANRSLNPRSLIFNVEQQEDSMLIGRAAMYLSLDGSYEGKLSGVGKSIAEGRLAILWCRGLAMRDPAEEWRQLHGLYTEMGDTELLELKRDSGDLTEMAPSELRDELKRRQLWNIPLPQTQPANAGHADSKTAYDSFGDLMLGGVAVGEYDTVKEAKLAAYVLDLKGVGAVVGNANGQFDLRFPFVRVAPEDAERAAGILAQSISAQVRADFEAIQNLPDFEVPACPRCSCTEVLLEEIEPTNKWLCEECNHRWQETAPKDARGGAG